MKARAKKLMPPAPHRVTDEYGREITVGSIIADGGQCSIGVVVSIIGNSVIAQSLCDDGFDIKPLGCTFRANDDCLLLYDPAHPELMLTQQQLSKMTAKRRVA